MAMDHIGAEVGQKMRSAIKAKLLELNCYVDDELPDYIMVMVANKRTKSQMKEDLQLFLANKTSTFVDWLHIVLKKLKEVTVTNPDVYKKAAKRKFDEDAANVQIKKEKKDKKVKKEPEKTSTDAVFKSLTDDLPINVNKLSEQRKIVIMKENKSNNSEVIHDNFDIPLLSEVNLSTEEELEDIEKKIKSVKSRLGLLVESDEETQKNEPQLEKMPEKKVFTPQKKPEHARITFEESSAPKRKSILERLGKRRSEPEESPQKRKRIDFSEFKKSENEREKEKRNLKSKGEKEKPKESVLSRLGVMSKVSVPSKPPEEPEEPFKNREVPSVVKIKPRIIPSDAPQANKNLLLKAVAEAQKSVAQAPTVGHNLKPDALFTKKYKEKQCAKKLPEEEKNKIKQILNKEEYVPETVSKESFPEYVPSSKEENGRVKQKFIVTLDGLEKTKYKNLIEEESPKVSIKERLDKKRSPSPIIFDSSPNAKVKNVPDKLPVVHAPTSIKNKERCKYWPSCRHGDKCEFVHPTTNCEKFPHCKFGAKCLYIHPNCKFGSSCTRRDCPYNHTATNAKNVTRVASSTKTAVLQTCKFFPNCTNVNCAFLHPKPCKFGKFCKNQEECTFSHVFSNKSSNLTWRSK